MQSRGPVARVAAIFDIHGNLPALEAVLDDIRRATVDEVVVGGDVFPGPMPIDVLSRLASLDIPVRYIKGNGDRVVLAARSGVDISEVPPPYQDVVRWAAKILSPEDARTVAVWPASLRVRVSGLGDV